jgi:hypothetical protein
MFESEESKERIAGLKSTMCAGGKSAPSEADILLDVRYKLKQARQVAHLSCDKVLLYFIDMAISHLGETLRNHLNSDFENDKSARVGRRGTVTKAGRSAAQ